MKKIVAMFIVLSVLLTVCSGCLADSFSVRGGINFNSTKAEILAYEETQGGKIQDKSREGGYFSDNCIQVSDITFAGYEDTIVIYYFDNEDKLISIYYDFHQSVDDRAPADKQFSIIDEGLAKYGDPIATGKEFLDINDAPDVIDYIHSSTLQDITSDARTDILAFSQRLVKLDSGYVDIKNLEFLWYYTMNLGGYKFPSYQYNVSVSYSFCTDEQIQAVEDKILEKKNALENDL